MDMHVWVPDDKDGFALCKIVDIGCECLTLQRLHEEETVGRSVRVKKIVVFFFEKNEKKDQRDYFQFRAFYDNVFPAGEEISQDVDDNCERFITEEYAVLVALIIYYRFFFPITAHSL